MGLSVGNGIFKWLEKLVVKRRTTHAVCFQPKPDPRSRARRFAARARGRRRPHGTHRQPRPVPGGRCSAWPPRHEASRSRASSRTRRFLARRRATPAAATRRLLNKRAGYRQVKTTSSISSATPGRLPRTSPRNSRRDTARVSSSPARRDRARTHRRVSSGQRP
jgi:hypothetical protein